MRLLVRLLTLLGALCVATSALALTPQQFELLFDNPKKASAAVTPGKPTSLTITDKNWTTPSDLGTSASYINGYTGTLQFKTLGVTGSTASYSVGTDASPKMQFTVQSPGYTTSAGATTVNRSIYAKSWLRQVYPNVTLPTENANSGNGQIGLVFNDFVYSGDTPETVTAYAGLYNSNSMGTTNTVTNNSTRTYPPVIGAWLTPKYQRLVFPYTVEFEAGQGYGMNSSPVAAVVFTASDGTHTVSHTVSSMSQSLQQVHTSCTATNGSNVLTACSSTNGFIAENTSVGIPCMRVTVPGVPGEPCVIAKTSTTLTLGTDLQTSFAALQGTPTLLGAIAISSTPADGAALADGAFAGAKINNANLNAGSDATVVAPTGTCTANCSTITLTLSAPASGQWIIGEWITGTNIPANDYIVSGGTGTGGAGTYKLAVIPSGTVSGTLTGSYIAACPSAATCATVSISTSATVGVASAGNTTIKEVYQGSTGSVTVTAGNPVYDFQGVFTSADFSGASFSNGPVYFRAQAYPWVGNSAAVLDTQLGADGTGCDWFYITAAVGAGTCNSSNSAFFAATAAGAWKIAANLHNLPEYYDLNTKYAPIYAWVSGTAGGASAVQTANTDPGSTAYYATAATALAAIKTYNNANNGHNDVNGGVVCMKVAGSPYASFGAAQNGNWNANEPAVTITSSLGSSGDNTCNQYGADNADLTVVWNKNATAADNDAPGYFYLNNMTVSATGSAIVGQDGQISTVFPTYYAQFNGDVMKCSGASVLFSFGNWDVLNSIDDETTNNCGLFSPTSTTGAFGLALGNTIIQGTQTTGPGIFRLANEWGNVGWAVSPQPGQGLQAVNWAYQMLSYTSGFNKWMGMLGSASQIFGWDDPQTSFSRILLVNSIFETIRDSGGAVTLEIGGDGVNTPTSHVVAQYNTTIGSRLNNFYNEGVPITPTASGAGSLTTSTNYVIQVDQARSPTAATTSTQGIAAAVSTGTHTAFNVALPCDPNYYYLIYIVQGNSGTIPTNYATVTGQTNTATHNITGCQVVAVTNIGASATPLTFGTGNAPNAYKPDDFQRFNIWRSWNLKAESYNGSGVNNNGANGGRVGDWEEFHHVGDIGDVYVTGTNNGLSPGPTSWLGMFLCDLCNYNPANTSADNSWVGYASDRSYEAGTGTPYAPSLNLGMGDYCPTVTTNVASLVPAGLAAWPYDIQGTARKNDGTGWAGAYENGCL